MKLKKNKIKTEILYYTGYTLQTFINQFEKLLDKYEYGEKDKQTKFNIEVLNDLIRITNIFLNTKPYELKLVCKKLSID